MYELYLPACARACLITKNYEGRMQPGKSMSASENKRSEFVSVGIKYPNAECRGAVPFLLISGKNVSVSRKNCIFFCSEPAIKSPTFDFWETQSSKDMIVIDKSRGVRVEGKGLASPFDEYIPAAACTRPF